MSRIHEKPHISLFKTGPCPHKFEPQKYKPNECWYVTLCWFKSRGFMQGGRGGQSDLTDWLPYNKAFSIAMKWGRKLRVAVLKNDSELIWRPLQRQTMIQKRLVKSILSGDKVKL